MTKARIEHQNSRWRRVRGVYAEHRPLVPEMKKDIPRQYPVKPPTKGQRPHTPSICS
jgi:hypothetical protein